MSVVEKKQLKLREENCLGGALSDTDNLIWYFLCFCHSTSTDTIIHCPHTYYIIPGAVPVVHNS